MNNKGWERKEIKNQPRLRNFHLNIFLTYNICVVSVCQLLKNVQKRVLSNITTLGARRKLA